MKRKNLTKNYNVNVTNHQKRLPLHLRKIKRLAASVLTLEEVNMRNPIELGIMLVSDRKMRLLNAKFHYQDKNTDVLAFPIDVSVPKEGPWILGEVVVSVERAAVQSKIFRMDVKKEVALYIIHGILHLLGYRDDKPLLAKRMWERQNYILKTIYRGI